MKKTFILILIAIVFIPSVTFASWWNPFTWKIFNRSPEIKIEKPITPTITPIDTSTQTTKEEPKKEVKEIKKQTNSTIKNEVSSDISWKAIEDYLLPIAEGQGLKEFFTMSDETNDSRIYIKENNTWIWKSDGKSKVNLFGGPSYNVLSSGADTLVCNQKPWSLCPAGQKFSCPETGNASCVSSSIAKNNNTETNQPPITSNQQDFTRPVGAPSPAQLKRLMAMCSLNEALATSCNSSTFITGYFTNMAFRSLTDDLAKKAEKILEEQKEQSELNRQRYLLYLQTIKQPTIQPSPQYETYSLPLYSGGLKLEAPQVNAPRKWEIKWTGGGAGYITDYSSNTQTNFQCDSLFGRCFTP